MLGAFVGGFFRMLAIMVGLVAYVGLTFLLASVSLWTLLPTLLGWCFIITYLREGPQWFTEQWNK